MKSLLKTSFLKTSLLKTTIGQLIFLFLLFAFTCPAWAAGELSSTEPAVLSVEVTGNQHVPEDLILRVVTNTRLGEPVDQEAVKRDLDAINQLGYFSSVDAHGEPFVGGVKIVFEVHENPVFKEFKIEGLKKAAPEQVIQYLSQKKGEVINYAQIHNDLNEAILKMRDQNGVVLTVVEDKTFISGDGVVTLYLTEVRLGKIKVEGLEKTKEEVVTRELTMEEGEVFDMNRLRSDYQRLTRLQLFKAINPIPQPTADPEVMDLLLEFEEGKTAQFNFGVTYTPETSQLAGFTKIIEPNLAGTGQRISFNVELNPESFYHLSFEFNEPWLDENHTSFGLKMYSNTDLEQVGVLEDESGEYKYDQKSTGLELSLGRPFGHDLRVDTSLQFEQVDFNPLPDSSESTLLPNSEEYWDNSFGIGVVQDKRELTNLFYTTDGYWAKLSANLHGSFLGGKYEYQQYLGEFKQFFSPWEYTTFGYRVKAGTMVGDVPDIGMFQIGGPLSLRGYGDGYQAGSELLLANFEIRQRMANNDNLEFVAFYDLGSVDNENYFQGYGVGLRYAVPLLGQLRFDIGWNEDGDYRGHFFIQEMF